MPLYEYDCPKCGRFETLQKLGDSPLRTHETCGSKVRRLISAGSFTFKGSGFYVNDYARKAAPACDRPEKGGSGACATCPAAEA
jgi:putative FmdB family regulatory protein